MLDMTVGNFPSDSRLHSALIYRSAADYEEVTIEGAAMAWTLLLYETEVRGRANRRATFRT